MTIWSSSATMNKQHTNSFHCGVTLQWKEFLRSEGSNVCNYRMNIHVCSFIKMCLPSKKLQRHHCQTWSLASSHQRTLITCARKIFRNHFCYIGVEMGNMLSGRPGSENSSYTTGAALLCFTTTSLCGEWSTTSPCVEWFTTSPCGEWSTTTACGEWYQFPSGLGTTKHHSSVL